MRPDRRRFTPVNAPRFTAFVTLTAALLASGSAVHAQQPDAGAVRITFDEADRAGVTSPQLLLQARVAGVEVIDDPRPGGGVTVRIRGGASLGNSEPLYVVDGMPLNFGGGFTAGGNPLDFVDVSDVESIAVLKGGAAMARYGARGGNGVVIIDTRHDDDERLRYEGWIGSAAPLGEPDVLGAAAFRDLVAAYDAREGTDLSSLLGSSRTDWRDEVQRSAISHDHALAFVGGGSDLSYRISGGYSSQPGVVDRTSAERASVAVGYAQTVAGRLHLRAHVRGARATDEILAPGVLGATYAMTPTEPVRDDGSPYGGFFEWDDPFAPDNPVAIQQLTDDEGTTSRRFGVFEAELDLPVAEPLSATFRVGRDRSSFERDASRGEELYSQAQLFEPGYSSRLDGDMSNSLVGLALSHRRSIGALDLDLGLGWSSEDFEVEAEFEDEQGSSGTGWEIELDGELSSLVARADLMLRDRYVVSLGVRSDEGADDERMTYPSAGLAWHLGGEPFLDDAPLGTLTLRGSWGRSATTDITRILFGSAYDMGRTMSSLQFGGFAPVFIPVDPDLVPEEVTAFDVGVDFASAAGRVSGALEFYARTTEDLIYPAPGFTNVGTLESRGLELSLDAVLLRGDEGGLEWRAGFVAATQRAEITELSGGTFLAGPIAGGVGNFIQVMQEGEAPNAFFVYQRRADNPDFGDMDGDGVVEPLDLYEDRDDNGIINGDDARAFESPAPAWILGHTSRLRWRTLDASFTLRAHLGNHVYNNVASLRGNLDALDFAGIPANVHESVNETGFEAPQYRSDYYVEDASFLRMDHFTVGWTRGAIRVFGSVRNAFTLTEYRGQDPEAGPAGIDYDPYPRARMVLLGANVRL